MTADSVQDRAETLGLDLYRRLADWLIEMTPEKLVDIYCDARVHLVNEYEPGDTIGAEAPGGGGTDFRPVSDEIARWDEPPKALIFLTDLDGQFPAEAPEYPVPWVRVGQHRTPPWGECVQITP